MINERIPKQFMKKSFSILLALAAILCMFSLTVFAEDDCTHEFDNDCDAICNICGVSRQVPGHAYDDECDTTCNVCNETRTAPHKYANDCDKECDLCKTTRTADHKYDNLDDAECNVCKEIREVRSPARKWWDENNAWIAYVLAGVIFVGGAIGVFLWIPKNKDKGGKKKSRK